MKKVLQMLQLIPIIWAGIEQLHGDKDHATKKQLAMEALGFASSVAASVEPQQAAAIQAASGLASSVIDGVANFANVTKQAAAQAGGGPALVSATGATTQQ